MHFYTTRRLSLALTILAAVCVALIGCGVSGKTSDEAASRTTSSSTTAARSTGSTETTTGTTRTVPDPGTTDTTVPDTGGGDTTIPTPGSDGRTIPDTSIPFGTGDVRSMLIRIYKQSGFTDKEARCVADLVVKGTGGGSIDPGKLDIQKLSALARKCFGADGVPGGND
jgi:hypothetical protein